MEIFWSISGARHAAMPLSSPQGRSNVERCNSRYEGEVDGFHVLVLIYKEVRMEVSTGFRALFCTCDTGHMVSVINVQLYLIAHSEMEGWVYI